MNRAADIAPAPLFQDPIYGGPTDPAVIWNREEKEWWMFYTQRRSTGRNLGVASIHGSKIGIASSPDGKEWLYRGTAMGLEWEPGHNTFWAPEVVYAEGQYHMYVSYVKGVPIKWSGKEQMLHYTASNLWEWNYAGKIDLHSESVIDASIYEIEPHKYKMWYKDENRGSHTCSAISEDLYHWEVLGEEITDCAQEGPNVFELGGKKWLLADCWDGMAVYESDDFKSWVRQEGNILREGGARSMDEQIGNHGDVVVIGENAYLFYFVHPYFPGELRNDEKHQLTKKEAETVVQAARLEIADGRLRCDRNKEFILFE